MNRLFAALLFLFLTLPAAAAPATQIVEGQAALQSGDTEAAARLWEEAAIADVQESFHLLVSLYESGPDPSPVRAFKWAWIGQARTWDPKLSKRASQDFDRLQDNVRREVRQQGREMAEEWLAKHPRPTP